MESLSWLPLLACFQSLQENRSHLMLFMYFQGFVTLTAIYYFVANHKPYQSNLMQITPGLSTPVPAGQKQYGSARWLSEKEIDLAFNSYLLNRNGEAKINSGGIVLGQKTVGDAEKIHYLNSTCVFY